MLFAVLLVSSCVSGQSTVASEALADSDSRFIQLKGIKTHYKEMGTGPRNIILLHGFSASLYTWDKVMPELSRYGRVVAYDRPPFGLTERIAPERIGAENPYAQDDQPEWVIALMDKMGMQKAVLIGCSAGGLVSVLTAMRYPERVEALVLVDPAIRYHPELSLLIPFTYIPPIEKFGPLYVRMFLNNGPQIYSNTYADPRRITKEMYERTFKPMQSADWDMGVWETSKVNAGWDYTALLKPLPMPILLITGDTDRVIPMFETVALTNTFRKAKLVIVSNCGHMIQEELPETFLKLVRDFFANLPD